MRILMVLIPDASSATRHLTLERVAGPYYRFAAAGLEIVLASPEGGAPRLSPDGASTSEDVRRFRTDRAARDALADTLALSDVDVDDFQAAYCVGVPGPGWQEPQHPASMMIARFLAAEKPVAIIPGQAGIDLHGEHRGLLIIGSGPQSPREATEALLGILTARPGNGDS